MSVASILQALAENAGQAQLRKGAIYGNLAQSAANVPAVISADRERDATLALHQSQVQQQMDLERARAGREEQLARHQDTSDAQAAQTQQHLGAIIGAGFAADPATFDLPSAVSKAQEIGRPDLIPTIAAVHDKFQPKLTEHDPTKALVNPTGNVVVAPTAKPLKTESEVALDATGGDAAAAMDLLKPKPKLTYSAPVSALVDGKRKFVRTGSDGKTYDLSGKEVPGDSIMPEGDKAPANSYQLQPELDATGKQTGRFLGYNTKTNRWEPVKGEGPTSTKAAPGAAAAATEATTKKATLDTLTQLDAAIEAAKDKIGPGAGRVSNVEQMIGSADPAIQALGVKMKAAKMQFDHAITGSVRAGASPLLIKQWDNILGNQVTPDGLKAGVQAMRELLGGESAKPASGIKSITLIKE